VSKINPGSEVHYGKEQDPSRKRKEETETAEEIKETFGQYHSFSAQKNLSLFKGKLCRGLPECSQDA